MTGHVVGGWEYIWLAYAISWSGIAFYAGSLFLKRRRDQRGDAP